MGDMTFFQMENCGIIIDNIIKRNGKNFVKNHIILAYLNNISSNIKRNMGKLKKFKTNNSLMHYPIRINPITSNVQIVLIDTYFQLSQVRVYL